MISSLDFLTGRRVAIAVAAVTAIWASSAETAWSQTTAAAGDAKATGPASAAPPDAPFLTVELNKLEAYEKGCRAFVVVDNPGSAAFQSVKLDLVLFQPDGVIGRRVAVDLAPLKSSKKTVKLFDLEGLACDRVASVLVNDVMECKAESGVVADCLTRIAFSSVASAKLTIR